MQVFVRVEAGHTLTLNNLKSETTIQQVKEQIQQKTNLSPAMQRLIFAGKQLQDDCTLADYKIEQENMIHLVSRLFGGMFHPSSGRQDFEPDGVQ